MSAFEPIEPDLQIEPLSVADETFVIRYVQEALGQPLFIYLNSLVIRSKEPVIVDTGAPANRRQWLEDVFSLVEPEDVRWVFLSHDDVDHSGNLDQVMEACPNATLVTTWAMVERHTNCFNFPLERCRWVDQGESFDVGDRTLTAMQPPVYDSPTTRGLYDSKTKLYWGVDSFATPLTSAPMDHISELDREVWEMGTALFAHGAVSRWLSMVDLDKWGAHVDTVQNLDIEKLVCCHTPVIDGPYIDQAFDLVRALPTIPPPPLPDQSVLDQVVAAASVPDS